MKAQAFQRSVLPLLLAACSAVLTGPRCLGQEALFDIKGTEVKEYFGAGIANVGDVNGDGIQDLWVNRVGITRVCAGQSGEVLLSLAVNAGPLSAAGDVNQDGYADLLWGGLAGFTEGAFVASGKTGQLLVESYGDGPDNKFGQTDVDQAGDVNGDGWPDIVVGAPGASGFDPVKTGIVYVISGLDGSRLWTFQAPDFEGDPKVPFSTSSNQFGYYVAGLGDQDLDGFCDVGGAPLDTPSKAYVYSGQTGATLGIVTPSTGELSGSWLFTNIGDLTQDGIPEMAYMDASGMAGGQYVGALDIFRGGTYDLYLRVVGTTPGLVFGFSASGGEDLNGDGTPDFLVTASDSQNQPGCSFPCLPGELWGFSGSDGAPLFTFVQDPFLELMNYGDNCALLGDTNGDGFSEFAAAAWTADFYGVNDAGLVRIYSGGELTLATNKLELPVAQGGSQLLRLKAEASHAGDFYLMLGTLSGIVPGLEFGGWHVPLNLDNYTLLGVTPGASPILGFLGVVDAAGKATATLKIPPGLPASFTGLNLQHCCVLLDPLSGTLTLVTNSVPLYLE